MSIHGRSRCAGPGRVRVCATDMHAHILTHRCTWYQATPPAPVGQPNALAAVSEVYPNDKHTHTHTHTHTHMHMPMHREQQQQTNTNID